MKKDSFIGFVLRNRYVILFVTIVLILAFTGIIGKIMEFLFTILLIIIAIYVGKRIQEDGKYISNMFRKRKEEISYSIKDDDNMR